MTDVTWLIIYKWKTTRWYYVQSQYIGTDLWNEICKLTMNHMSHRDMVHFDMKFGSLHSIFDRNPTFQSKQQKNRGIWVYIFIIKIFPFRKSKEKITSFKQITSNNHRALHFHTFFQLRHRHHMWSQSETNNMITWEIKPYWTEC